MAEPKNIAPLLQALRELMNWFETEQVQGIVIGGVAASLLGRPRVTNDVDALVLTAEEKWSEFLMQAGQYQFRPRIGDALAFARESRMLLLEHEPSHIEIDITFAALPFEEQSIQTARNVEVGDLTLRLPTPEDLIIMKAVAARPKDLVDIESLIEANPNLDLKRIRRMVQEFSSALDMPDLIENLERILEKLTEG